MFGRVVRPDGDAAVVVAADPATGRPLHFARPGCSPCPVTAVHGRWREWSIDGADTECWRVESGADLVVVLALDLDRMRWYLRQVWD